MYSVVLMAALTTGVDLPDIGHRGGGGCCGCYGGSGGGRGHGHRGGGCYGGGCYGGGYSMACYGGGMGMGYGGCYGSGMGYGGCYGSGMGYGGCYGGGMGYGGGMMMPGTMTTPGTTTTPEKLKSTPKTTMFPAPATIQVSLPADAKLFVGNEATTSTGTSRLLQSPELNPGRAYRYTLKAEVVRDGKTITAEKVVEVKAGELATATLTLPETGVAQR